MGVILNGIHGSKRVARTWNTMNTMNTILITFFDIKGNVHVKFIPQSHTVNRAYYMEILKRLLEAVGIKMPELWPSDLTVHHDNAPAHKELFVKEFLAPPPKNRLLKWDTLHMPLS
jgi:hypothetical protein